MKRLDGRSALCALALVLIVGCNSSSSSGGSGGHGGGSGGSSGSGGAAGPDAGGGSGGKTGSGGTTTGTGGSDEGNGGASGMDARAELPPAPTSSGVTPTTKKISDLTADEKKKLCDFRAAKYGGYAQSIDCGNGTTIGSDDNLEQCLGPDGLAGDCATATVADYEKCTTDTTCDDAQPDSCQILMFCK